MKPIFRPETTADFESIREVNDLAFGQKAEGALVDALRHGGNARHLMIAGPMAAKP